MNKKSVLLAVVIFMAVAVVAGAAVLFLYPYQPNNPPQVNSAGWTEEGVSKVVNANNQFAFDLYADLSKSERGNIFYSPYSISAALAMVYEGAERKTTKEIKSVFHYPGKSLLEPNFARIYNLINKGEKQYELRTGNALWVQRDFPLLKNYLDKVEKYYGGKAANLDFKKEPEKSRQTINSFIEEQTNNKIVNLIAKGMIGPLTKLILTNAIYFKGKWVWQFDKSETRERNFKVSPDKKVKVKMMYMKPDKALFNYADLESLQILELPYKGKEVSMLILLPKKGVKDLESSLSLTKLNKWKSKMAPAHLDGIYIPRFKFRTDYRLNGNLKEMGMTTAFSPRADFSGMTGGRDLMIDFVIHKAYIDVDEEGTEAAAATAVGMREISALPSKIFRADHPFIFLIQDRKTGNILFLGKVVDPTAE